MTPDFPDIESSHPMAAGPSLLRELVEACLAVHSRLGPHCPRAMYIESLSRELRDAGIQASACHLGRRSTSAGSSQTGVLRSVTSGDFALIVEACLALELTELPPSENEDPERRLRLFKERLRLNGLETGLMVDFDQADLSEGLWLAQLAPHADRFSGASPSYPGRN